MIARQEDMWKVVKYNGCLPSLKSRWVFVLLYSHGEGLKRCWEQRKTIVVSNADDGNFLKEDLLVVSDCPFGYEK